MTSPVDTNTSPSNSLTLIVNKEYTLTFSGGHTISANDNVFFTKSDTCLPPPPPHTPPPSPPGPCTVISFDGPYTSKTTETTCRALPRGNEPYTVQYSWQLALSDCSTFSPYMVLSWNNMGKDQAIGDPNTNTVRGEANFRFWPNRYGVDHYGDQMGFAYGPDGAAGDYAKCDDRMVTVRITKSENTGGGVTIKGYIRFDGGDWYEQGPFFTYFHPPYTSYNTGPINMEEDTFNLQIMNPPQHWNSPPTTGTIQDIKIWHEVVVP